MSFPSSGEMQDRSAGSLGRILHEAVSAVPNPTMPQGKILAALTALQARLEEGLLRVAALGQFKRGKSTLLNALLGAPLLPAGIIPVTAIPTFIRGGERATAKIVFAHGKPAVTVSGEAEVKQALGQYISEAENPENRLRVEKVELEFPSRFLRRGVAVIDTPGIGSTFLHNTRTAAAVLSECDVALFVVSADPPITEAEVNYLADVRRLIPKIFFVLNKKDLLEAEETETAEDFLAKVLEKQLGFAQQPRIFCVSGKQGLHAKEQGDPQELERSGIGHLEEVLADELAREKQKIIHAAAHRRAIGMVADLLFQSELEHKALLLPEETLKQKAAIFENSVTRFERERQNLSDYISVDRAHLLKEFETESELLWKNAQTEMAHELDALAEQGVDAKAASKSLGARLTARFARSFGDFVDRFDAKLQSRLAAHRQRAQSLLDLVRQTAADLMEISVNGPAPDDKLDVRREPYWVSPEPSASLMELSVGALDGFLPRQMRERRLYERLKVQAARAVLRNAANLDWAMRQNIEEAFRQSESALAEQLEHALQATREALRRAVAQRKDRADQFDSHIRQAADSLASLRQILPRLEDAKAPGFSL
ncbi:MAG TPA: dynamin family protein [Hyphomicrobiales bacterium]|nr:dynamin family protein [Hyphomicrobiales bacterium]